MDWNFREPSVNFPWQFPWQFFGGMMTGLADKRVLVTGGASGIGAATVERFIDEGARVVVLDRDAMANRDIAARLPALVGTLTVDVTDADGVARAFDTLDQMCGGLDVLINNAGISIRHPFLEITPDEWRRVMDVNLNGLFFVAQQAARRMMQADGGVLLHTASTNGIVGYSRYADYNRVEGRRYRAGAFDGGRAGTEDSGQRDLPRLCHDPDAGSRVHA